jgi:hypothetical protein
MRSVVPFETERDSSSIDETLSTYDWMIDAGITSPEERRAFWLLQIEDAAPHAVLLAQEAAWKSQQDAERELERSFGGEATIVLEKQHEATEAQAAAMVAERQIIVSTDGDGPAGSPRGVGPVPVRLVQLAAREAGEILHQVAEDDKELALITFQYPIFDRQTQTFGTVHYESDKHHTTIRLKNTHSEKLKIATQRLVEDVVRGRVPDRRSVRVWSATKAVGQSLLRAWFRSPHRYRRPVVFARVKVLEPRSSNEAFSGIVVAERSLAAVLRERRGDLIVAGVFLVLGVTASLLSSPWVWDFDRRLQTLTIWRDGWLAWAAGNMSRIGSAFFVGVFLPIIQVWLYWRSVRRKPSIEWNIDVAEP